MRMPPIEISLLRLAETYGVYHLAQLIAHVKAEMEAHPPKPGDPPTKLALMLAVWVKLMGSLDGQILKISGTRRKRVEGRAGLDLSNLTADRFLGRFSGAVKSDQSSPAAKVAKKKLLDQNPSDIAALPLADQIQAMEDLGKALPGTDLPIAKGMHPELVKTTAGLDGAFKGYGTLRRAHSDAKHEGENIEIDWRRVYSAHAGALRELYPDDPALVEIFFYKESRQDREEDEKPATETGG